MSHASLPHQRPARLLAALLSCALLGAAPAIGAADGSEKRCGWLMNPTPANFELLDRQGSWLLSSQGGYQARGIDDMPDMSAGGWVSTNGSYGHGCACMKVKTNKRTKRITRLISAEPLPLARCRGDRTLPKPY